MEPLVRSVALRRYLERHIEPDLPPPPNGSPWDHALVIPAYREQASLLTSLRHLPAGTAGRVLVVLVVNRPDSDTDETANALLRSATHALPKKEPGSGAALYSLAEHADLYLLDLEKHHRTLPEKAGVGLARKFGCDLILSWMAAGAVRGRWICTTDADALLPDDYFMRLETSAGAAAVFPFRHTPGFFDACNRATQLYELRLHHYVLGLEYAASPYAFHTLGSCIAVDATAYAQVRGIPKRAGGEDFYLLNKIAKTGAVTCLSGACITLESRMSDRVPFGTGPAVRKITRAGDFAALPLFYHPEVFQALKAVLQRMPAFFEEPDETPATALLSAGLEPSLAQATASTLQSMGLEAALAHCRKQGKSREQFTSQFHQWFDGFRTLKFVHAMESHAYPRQNIEQLQSLQPALWPTGTPAGAATGELLHAVRRHWSWTTAN